MFLELDVEVSFSFDSSSTTGFEFNSLGASLLTVLRVIYAIVRLSSEPCGLDVTISTRYDWSVARQSTSYSLRLWNLRNLTLQQECYLTTFLSITRDLNRQHKTFARLYDAAASPASRLRSAGSLAIKVTVPKKTSLLSLSSRLYHVIMKLKCKARRYLSLFSCNSESHMTNYFSFKLSTDVEKNPGPSQSNTDSHETTIKPVIQSASSIMQLVSPVILMRSRLYELGLQAKDVGGAGDCFFRSVSHQLYGNSNDHMQVRIAGVQYMRDHPERFVESNTDNSWLRYLNDMCIQGTWSDALIVQAVADALNVVIHIVESNPGFSPITTVYPVQERNSLSTITIGHIDECHYVSTTPLQSNASISMYNKSTTDIQSSINKQILCPYMQYVSLLSNHVLTRILQHCRLSMNMHVCFMKSVICTVLAKCLLL